MTNAAVVARTCVLLVEKDADARAAHVRALARAGHDVVAAATIDEAARLADERCPDLAVLACRLPDGSGIDLLRRWRASSRTAALPVLLLARLSTPNELHEATRAGANAVVLEPCSGDMLIRYLWRILQGTMTARCRTASLPPITAPDSSSNDHEVDDRVASRLHEHEGFFHTRCEHCLRGSPPLGGEVTEAERRACALGWSRNSDGWECPVCIERYKTSAFASRRWRVTSASRSH